MSETESFGNGISSNPERETATRKRFSRRAFAKLSAVYGAGLAGLLSDFATRRSLGEDSQEAASRHLDPLAPVEYIVVGSGAGVGPLACNLAKAGHKVVLISQRSPKIQPCVRIFTCGTMPSRQFKSPQQVT